MLRHDFIPCHIFIKITAVIKICQLVGVGTVNNFLFQLPLNSYIATHTQHTYSRTENIKNRLFVNLQIFFTPSDKHFCIGIAFCVDLTHIS